MMQKKRFIIHNSLFIILFFIAFLERTVFDLGPNIELLTSAIVLSAYFLGGRKIILMTLIAIALSDRIIGNSKILLFTWTGFLIPSLVLPWLFKKIKLEIRNSKWKYILLPGTGIASNLFFYIHTNFGVWLLDSWGMYEKNLTGLLRCYINGLPFLKNEIVSSIFFIPVGFLILHAAEKLSLRLTGLQKPSSNLSKI